MLSLATLAGSQKKTIPYSLVSKMKIVHLLSHGSLQLVASRSRRLAQVIGWQVASILYTPFNCKQACQY